MDAKNVRFESKQVVERVGALGPHREGSGQTHNETTLSKRHISRDGVMVRADAFCPDAGPGNGPGGQNIVNSSSTTSSGQRSWAQGQARL